jgi:hypothetical protein
VLYVYYTKDQQELEDVRSKSIMGGRYASIDDAEKRRILALNGSIDNANENLKRGLSKENVDESITAVKQFIDAFHNRMNGLRGFPIFFFIHFGSQSVDGSRRLTMKMQEAVKKSTDLSSYRFLAVSRHNRHPSGFFKEGKFTLPNDSTIERALQEKVEGYIGQPYPHLRALVILCQALLQLSVEERLEIIKSVAWRKEFGWKVVDGRCKDFTDKENDLLMNKAAFRTLMACKNTIGMQTLEIRDAQEKTIRDIIKTCLEVIEK